MLANILKKSKLWGVIFPAVPVLVALVLWFSQKNFNGVSIFKLLGQAAGISGITLLALNFIFTARLRFIEKIFGGLDKVYREHHNNGTVAFLLILAHPTLLVFDYALVSLSLAVGFLLPVNNVPVIFGEVAIIIMAILLFITFYVYLSYHVWKFSHQLLGVALFFAWQHLLHIPSDVSNNLLLRYYLLGIVTLGLLAYVYRTILGRFLVPRKSYEVVKKSNRGADILEMEMKPLDGRLNFEAGQFVFFQFPKALGLEAHPFSLTSDPREVNISVGIKNSGDYTAQIQKVNVGDKVRVEGPYGGFNYQKYGEKQLWVAGGIGVTPFLSMAADLKRNPKVDVVTFYVVSLKDEAVFLGKLPDKTVLYESEREGRITAQVLAAKVLDYRERDILLCGPAKMMADLRSQFRALGVSDDKIIFEDFSLM